MPLSRQSMAFMAAQYCETVRKAARLYRLAQRDLEDSYERLGGLKGVDYAVPRVQQPPERDAIAKGLERMEKTVRRLTSAMGEYADAVAGFDACVAGMEPVNAAILRAHYVRCQTWPSIAEDLGYSEAHVKGVMRTDALVELYERLPEEFKVPRAT